MRLQRILAALLLTVTATSASAETQPPLTALISVEPGAQPGHFLVDYKLSRPLLQLQLYWPAAAVRAESWHLGGSLALQGDSIVSLDGHAFDHFSLEIAELPEHADRQNDPVDSFSDGSAVIFTGLFNIAGPLAANRFHFAPAPGQAVVFLGRRVDHGFYWTPDRAATYVYFGGITPLSGEGFSAVLDPALPEWLSAELKQDLPAIFSRYQRLFGVKLKETPQIFFDYRFRDQPYLNYVGTAEPGAIRFEIRGSQWQQQRPESLLRAVAFFAHEAVHLWNGGLYHVAKLDESPWLDEGGADALSFDTVHALGLTDEAARLGRYSTAFNACLLDMQVNHATIADSAHGVAPYDCGAALAFLADAALRRHDPSLGLADLWKTTFQAAAGNHGVYSAGSYFAALDRLTGSKDASTQLRSFLTAKPAELRQGMLAALKGGGYGILSDAPNPGDGQQLATLLFGFVMGADCGWHSSFTSHVDHLTLAPKPGCHALDRPYNVAGVGGHDLFLDAPAAFDYVTQRCHEHQAITVNLYQDPRTLDVHCEWQAPAMPALIRIAAAESPHATEGAP